MDNRKRPNSKVVRLRRNGDPSDEERQRLASTIFAEEDEVGTFSRGNLVPPPPATPSASDEPTAADPFFEQLQAPNLSTHTRDVEIDGDDATSEYFERLGSQTPAEMSESIVPQPPAATMPGSARLSRQPAISRRGRLRRRHAATSPVSRPLSIQRVRTVAPPLLGALGVLVVVGAALAALVGSGGHSALTSKRLAAQRASPSPSPHATQTIPAQLGATKPTSGARHHRPRQRNSGKGRRRRAPKVHVVLAADHGSTPAASSSSSAVVTVDHPASQTQSTLGTSRSTSGAPVADTTSGLASSASSGASSRPAFGLNGTLGPGHSPNG